MGDRIVIPGASGLQLSKLNMRISSAPIAKSSSIIPLSWTFQPERFMIEYIDLVKDSEMVIRVAVALLNQLLRACTSFESGSPKSWSALSGMEDWDGGKAIKSFGGAGRVLPPHMSSVTGHWVWSFPTSPQGSTMAAPSQSVEEALQDALNHSTPAPMLIELIKAYPKRTTILDLISLYTELVAAQPNQVDKLAEALVEVKTSKVKIDITDNLGRPAQLDIEPIFVRELADFLSGDLANDIDTSVTPSNDYLIASLLSAASRKHRLGESPAQVGSVLRGLYYSDREHGDADPETFEVLVLGACLQLLASGSYLYGPKGIHFGKIDVLSALQAAKEEGVVKNPNGQGLLEATIQQAKSGFKQDIESAWNILFPQEK